MLKKLVLLIVFMMLVGCAGWSKRHTHSMSHNVSSSESVKKTNPNLKVGASDWVVNNGNCVLTFPYDAVGNNKNAFIVADETFAKSLMEFRTEIGTSSNPKIVKKIEWTGGCDSNGKASGYGQLYAALFPDPIIRFGEDHHWLTLEGTVKDGQFYGQVKAETGYTYTGTLGRHKTEFYSEDGKFFWSENDLQEYKKPSLKIARLKDEANKEEKERAAQEHTAAVEAKCMNTPKCRAKKEQEERERQAQRERERQYEREHKCDHVYAGKTFKGPGGIFGIIQSYEVIGFSPSTGQVTIRRPSGDTQEIACDDIPK
jgi:hypothetical protein